MYVRVRLWQNKFPKVKTYRIVLFFRFSIHLLRFWRIRLTRTTFRQQRKYLYTYALHTADHRAMMVGIPVRFSIICWKLVYAQVVGFILLIIRGRLLQCSIRRALTANKLTYVRTNKLIEIGKRTSSWSTHTHTHTPHLCAD